MPYRDEDDELQIVIEERGGGVRTFLLGALVGAGVALLLAPRGGRETQGELARALGGTLGGLRDRAGGPVDGARTSLTDWVGRARGRVTGRLDEVRTAVDDRVGRVRGAVDEGRMAARQARVELRRRVDEAKATYRAGLAGTAPVPPSIAPSGSAGAIAPAEAPAARGAADEVVVTRVAAERDAGDLAG
jgi:gas vesicle protein